MWKTDLDIKDYSIDITATDSNNNSKTYEGIDKFTTIPFSPTSNILVVDNSRYASYINYFTDALDSNQYQYNMWNFGLRGEITEQTLSTYKILPVTRDLNVETPIGKLFNFMAWAPS